MKKCLSILLLLCLIGPFAFTFSWLQYQRYIVRKSVKRAMIEGLDEKELVTLSFSRKEADSVLEWEHSREFGYRGEMYDIVRSEEHGDSVTYRCWPDREESQLNRQLASIVDLHMDKRQPNNRAQQDHLVQFIKLFFYEETVQARPFACIDSHTASSDLFCDTGYISSPPIPPPWCV